MTAALEEVEWSVSRLGRSLPQKKTRHPLYRRLGGSQGRKSVVLREVLLILLCEVEFAVVLYLVRCWRATMFGCVLSD